MRLDEELILALLQYGADSYLVGYRWDCLSIYHALRVRRRVAWLVQQNPSLISSSILSLNPVSSKSDSEFREAIEQFRSSLAPIPETVEIVFVNRGQETSIVMFVHHLFADGTALWNLALAIFGDSQEPLKDSPKISHAEKEIVKRVRSQLNGIAPSVVPVEIWCPSLSVTGPLLDAVAKSIFDTGLFCRLVTPRRTDDASGRMWGSKVKYESIYETLIGSVGNKQMKLIASLSADLFAQGDSIVGLIPKGVFSFSQRTDCDVVIEEIAGNVRVLFSARDKSIESRVLPAIKCSLEMLNGQG